MSYGVVATRAAQVQIEHGPPGEPHAEPRGRHLLRRPEVPDDDASWAAGRLTLTSRHLSFVPSSRSSDVLALTLALVDVTSVETSSGRVHRTVTIRTPDVVLRARVPGATAFAQRLSTSVETSHKRDATPRRPSPKPEQDPSIRSTN